MLDEAPFDVTEVCFDVFSFHFIYNILIIQYNLFFRLFKKNVILSSYGVVLTMVALTWDLTVQKRAILVVPSGQKSPGNMKIVTVHLVKNNAQIQNAQN